MWSFEVRGAPPEYTVPVVGTKVDNRMAPETMARMASHAEQNRSRNIMRENMATAKVSRPGGKAATVASSVGSRK